MHRNLYTRLVMLGPATGARSAVASTIEAYRAQGLFRRWPLDYVADYLVPTRLAGLVQRVARHRRVVLHVNLQASRFWRDTAIVPAALAARSPVLLQLHGGGFAALYEASSGPARAALRFFLEQAACVLVPSEAMRGWVRGIARHAETRCIPPPIATADRVAAGRQNLVLFLGRLQPEKGVFDLLDAVSALRGVVPDLQLVCAGEGSSRAVRRYARHLGIAEAVKTLGWVGPAGKKALFDSAVAYARPAYDDGPPLSMLEAMAAGVPVIASPVGGVPEAVVDGVSGFLVAPGNAASLQRVLRRLLLERGLAARIGAAGRESVQLRFAADRMVARLEEVYAAAGLTTEDAGGTVSDAGMREAH